jgi:hypothetical protein
MLFKIWSFHGGDYEGYRLLGCGTVWVSLEPNIPNPNPSPYTYSGNYLLDCSYIAQTPFPPPISDNPIS